VVSTERVLQSIRRQIISVLGGVFFGTQLGVGESQGDLLVQFPHLGNREYNNQLKPNTENERKPYKVAGIARRGRNGTVPWCVHGRCCAQARKRSGTRQRKGREDLG
jgi:hypothetical protein